MPRKLVLPLAFLVVIPGLATAADLLLIPGYYVSSDIPCSDDSNATLQLVTRHQFNWPQQACAIAEEVLATGTVYAVAIDCEETVDFAAERLNITLDIPDDQHYGLAFSGETPTRMRYCPQSEMPEPWRSNDLSDLIR